MLHIRYNFKKKLAKGSCYILLSVKGNDFYLNDKKFRIYSGAVHYFRTVPEYWEDRLLKLRAAGFNTVETYVCWNMHEPRKGQFDFSGILDIERFIKTAGELGLYAIVRPGPYICAEWDFGGFPAWLLADSDMRLRCYYEPFLKHVRDYFAGLLGRLAPLQITKGGNIIAMQVENEYGSYGNDKRYLEYLEQLMRGMGIDVMLFTSDGGQNDMLSGGTLPHLFKTANFGSHVSENFAALRRFQPEGPLMCCEFWDGWFDAWGNECHGSRTTENLIADFKAMLDKDASVNFYMFHGGTNFGFTSGANRYETYTPTVTSYDYDALLNEWGGYTPKYHAVRELLLAHRGIEGDPLPPEPPLQSIGEVALTQESSLFAQLDALGTRHESVTAEYMERYGQNHGLILYRHRLKGSYSDSSLFVDGLHDRAYVYQDGALQDVLWRNDPDGSFASIDAFDAESVIDVLVEAMGHVNYGPALYDRKGAKQIRLNNQIFSHYEIYTLPLDNVENVDYAAGKTSFPVFLKGSFRADSKADCFVHLDGFTKGIVWVNGFNLGRYWKIGPQKSLYLPGTLLKENNEIVVLELEGYKDAAVSILDRHEIGPKQESR